MHLIKKVLNDMFTEADNRTFDLATVMALLAIANGLGLATYEVVWKGTAFDFTQFGTGVGVLFAGLAAVLGFKKESNDKPQS